MNIRDAILAAADHIEANPKQFSFMSIEQPSRPHCGTPGCALGWIGAFGGYRSMIFQGHRASLPALGLPESSDGAHMFYARMDSLKGRLSWQSDAADCAVTLRRYADKYHPATEQKPTIDVGSWSAIASICGYTPKVSA